MTHRCDSQRLRIFLECSRSISFTNYPWWWWMNMNLFHIYFTDSLQIHMGRELAIFVANREVFRRHSSEQFDIIKQILLYLPSIWSTQSNNSFVRFLRIHKPLRCILCSGTSAIIPCKREHSACLYSRCLRIFACWLHSSQCGEYTCVCVVCSLHDANGHVLLFCCC